ncbi:MAG: CPBP family intramembrane metalloprotease [Clostridia bacterium]|jgi:hypothetical protein|nr:CPBP family intramembrane metalloprotease [Clostridia bacterium]
MKNAQNEIKTEIEKRNIYKDDDSGKVFLFAIVSPLLLALIISFVISQIARGQEIDSSVITENIGYSIAYSICTFLMFAVIFFLYNKKQKISFKAVNLNFKMKWHTYLLMVLVGVISLFGIQYFIGAFDNFLKVVGYPLDNSLSGLNPTSWWTYLLSIVLLAILPSIYEEFIFRGMILNGLRSRFNDYVSILLSALMFAIMHNNIQQLIYPFLLGCIMGWIVLRTGSLVSSIIVHFINNFLVVTFAYIENATGFSLSLADTWWFYLFAIALLATTFAIYYLIDRYYFKHKSKEERERTSVKTSKYLYISFAVAGVLYLVATITTIVMG